MLYFWLVNTYHDRIKKVVYGNTMLGNFTLETTTGLFNAASWELPKPPNKAINISLKLSMSRVVHIFSKVLKLIIRKKTCESA